MTGKGTERTYFEAAHAMQTGVALEEEQGNESLTPKNLRVGVNIALRDLGSLTRLLVNKGVITDREVIEAMTRGMNEEAEFYEERLGVHLA